MTRLMQAAHLLFQGAELHEEFFFFSLLFVLHVPSAPWSSERRSVSFLTVFRMELKRPGVFFISAMDAALPQPCLLVTAHV